MFGDTIAAGTGRLPHEGDRMESLLPEGWPRPAGYSNGVRVPTGRELVFVAGMVGWDESPPGGPAP